MDFDASQQLRILRDIHDTKPVADEEGNWRYAPAMPRKPKMATST